MTKVVWPLMKNNITRSDLDKLIQHLQHDDPVLTNGPLVKSFETEWSKWLGVKYSVMLNSGSSANDLTMLALSELKGPGEVIVPPLTWVSDISSVLRAGMDPVFVDINPKSLAIDTEKILLAITPQTRAVFLTHVLGFNGLTDRLVDELKQRGILLVEDVCESHGATHNGLKLGSIGWASNFSFYYAHHITTIEGGIISTNDENLYDLLRMLRSHGMVRESLNSETRAKYIKDNPDLNPDFIFAFPSHNMRATEINGILGLEQLRRLDQNVVARTKNFQRFLDILDPRVFQTEFDEAGSSNYAFTLILREPNFAIRDEVEALLKSAGIEFRRGLSGGGNQLRQPYLRKLRNLPNPESFPVAEHIHHFSWYLGNYPDLAPEHIDMLGNLLSRVS